MSLRPRSSGIFIGLVMIVFGALFLLHNYRGFEFHDVFRHWWPLIIIFWGVLKLYERTSGGPLEPGGSRITAGEVFLILGLLALVGVVIAVDAAREKFPGTHIE
ncbi:MAG: DUF5668 domain-containing protein, partial [Candidatus Acidiferrum sp.]